MRIFQNSRNVAFVAGWATQQKIVVRRIRTRSLKPKPSAQPQNPKGKDGKLESPQDVELVGKGGRKAKGRGGGNKFRREGEDDEQDDDYEDEDEPEGSEDPEPEGEDPSGSICVFVGRLPL